MRSNTLAAVLAATLCVPTGAWAATYSYIAYPYDPAQLYSYTNASCGEGSCANFTAAMAPTATITTTVPLAPNLVNTDITLSATVSAFSAFDGLTTYNYNAYDDPSLPANDPLVRLYQITVTTNAAGQLTEMRLLALRWQNPGPHTGSNTRIDALYTSPNGGAYHNVRCTSVDIEDRCNTWEGPGTYDGNSSTASIGALPPAVVTGAQSVPVDSPLALGMTALAMLGMARRRPASKIQIKTTKNIATSA